MEKEQKITGLFPDLIIHPGETLAEVLEDREMSQKELLFVVLGTWFWSQPSREETRLQELLEVMV